MGRIKVRLQPRASSNEIVGERNGAIVVRVTAPPVDGKANEALVKLVAKELGVAKSKVTIVRGETSRDKVLEIVGSASEEAQSRLDQKK